MNLLTSAIAGRPLEVGEAGVGERAWTDGETVFVDARVDAADLVRMVAVQASLLAAGSLRPRVARQLARRPALARRYLAVEGHRALVANELVLPPGVRTLIDRSLGASIDGPESSLALARGRGATTEPPQVFGVIRPGRLRHPSVLAPEVVVHTTTSGARIVDDEPDDDDDEAQLGDVLSSPVGGQGALGRLLQRLLSPARGSGAGGPAGTNGTSGVGQSRGAGAPTVGAPAVREAAAAFVPRARTYPEWDTHRKRYRPGWCTVNERDPAPEDMAPMAMPDGWTLRRPLARLGTDLARTRRRPQGDDIDVDAAVEARVETLAGSPPDEAVYVESLRRRRDLAVLILLDVSGSAGEPGPAGRTVHEHQRAAAAALTTALHDLGDRVALYAFNSQGRRAVHVTRVKGFDDRLDGLAVRRLGGLVPAAYTRLGAAIRHGGSVLEERGGTSRRLLLVLSDGFAYDHGYEGRYGEADARRALAEVRRRGTGCLCLSVGASTGPADLRRVFGTAAHAAVPSADQLPGLIGPLFRAEIERRRT